MIEGATVSAQRRDLMAGEQSRTNTASDRPGARFADLGPLFDPRSVAVVGASADETRIGGRPIFYMKQHGYAGRLYPVNPKRSEVQGLASFPDLAALPEAPDVAVVSVPSDQVLDQLEACAARGVKIAIVFSSGFAETGAQGAADQAAIAALAHRTGLRVLGPNCLGVMSLPSRVFCTFSAAPALELPPSGGISIVSQSGAFGTYTFVTGARRGLPMGRWIATGNEADIDFADGVAWLAGDPETQVIMGYMEGFRDGRKLIAALELARAAGKPVVVMKVGGTVAGAEAAQSHTAALSGSKAVFEAVLRQCGVQIASSVDEFFDTGYACLHGLEPTSRRLGLLTVSGGAGVLMADAAEHARLETPALPDSAQAALKAIVPFAGARNPVDITGQSTNDPNAFGQFIQVMVEDGGFGAIGCFLALGGALPKAVPNVLSAWTRIRAAYPDTPFFAAMMASPEVSRMLEALKVPVFDEPTRMVRAIAAMADLAAARAKPPRPADPLRALALPGAAIDEAGASRLLSRAGIPMAPFEIAADREAAAAAAKRLGFPAVVKVLSEAIAHKTDVQGVALDLADANAVAEAFDAVVARTRAAKPDAAIQGVLVMPMIADGVDVILGARDDPTFGPMVMVGLGGVMVEVLEDISFRAAPVSREEAIEMVAELRGAVLLAGLRGRPPADTPALVDAIVALGDFAARHAGLFDSIEINPLRVLPQGQGVIGLDALITPPGRQP